MKALYLLPVRLYQLVISPHMPNICRFQPSCSNYFVEAVETHGIVRGSFLGIRRLFRCRPGGGRGFDPVPTPRDN
ncbi:MAG: membrane protein insertion efficiency factor YidD [Planctomycetota bacterium]